MLSKVEGHTESEHHSMPATESTASATTDVAPETDEVD